MQFKRYQHIERLESEEVERILDGIVYIQPKIDGSNAQIYLNDNNEIEFSSRNRILTLEKDNKSFMSMMLQESMFNKLKALFEYVPAFNLVGEWLVPHSLKTYKDDAWRKFYVFDIICNKKYLSYEEYQPILEKFGIDYVPVQAIYDHPMKEQLYKELEKNTYLIKDGAGVGEGIVIKRYNFINKFGRVTWAKIVRNEFKELNKKEFGIRVCSGVLEKEKDIINKCLSDHLVEKVYAKIVNECGVWDNKYFVRLFNTVYYDFIKEELWEVLKKFNNPIIDFAKLKKYLILRVKEVKNSV